MKQKYKYLISRLYSGLYKHYGPQGWWPVSDCKSSKGSIDYHPAVYNYPKTDYQRLQICLGAILTQNTKWSNAAAALKKLASNDLISISGLLNADIGTIATLVKPAGYYNQKAAYLKNLVLFLDSEPFDALCSENKSELREKLLKVKGLGPETVDCILLYALNHCSFVVDAYTQRILGKLGIIENNTPYDMVKSIFETSIKQDLIIYQEYHALLVIHGKNYYSRKPYGTNDPVIPHL